MTKIPIKRFTIITLIFLSVMIAFVGCYEEPNTKNTESLPNSVTSIVSPERLKDLEDLGITINKGTTPPNIEGSYRVSPFKKINANFDDPYNEVLDYTYTFSEQDNTALTVMVGEYNNEDGTVGTGSGELQGAAISGHGNLFSIFAKIHTDYPNGAKSDMISVISGELTDEGIKNFQYALIMDDNYGNANDYLIGNGQGRLWATDNEISFKLLKNVNGIFQYAGTAFKYPTSATVGGDENFDVEYDIHDEDTYSTNFSYSDDYFNLPSTNNYNHELATMSLKLAMAAFGLNQDKNGTKYGWNNFGERTSNIRGLLGFSGMGFKDVTPMGYYHQPENNKSIAATFAHKLINGSELIVIAVRGGLYEAEWGDNFRVGIGNEHEGFANARDIVMDSLKTYLAVNIPNNAKVKFWITGYSRGAAVANMVAAKLTKEAKISTYNISKDSIYAYCFATPRNSRDAKQAGFENIINIINPTDPVPHFAFGHEDWGLLGDTWGFNRYGITKFLQGPNDGDFSTRESNMFQKLNSLNNPFKETTYAIDSFRFHDGNFGWGKLYDVKDNSADWSIQTYLEDYHGLIGLFYSVFGSQFDYVLNYQNSAIVNTSKFENGKVKGFMGILDNLYFGDEVTIAINFRSAVATLGIPGNVHYNYKTGSNDTWDYGTQQEANDQCLEAQRNALAVSQGHFPELYLAWMMSGSANCFGNK